MVIIFFKQGRFGNQLFQYTGLKVLFPEAQLFLVGFESLSNSISNVDAVIYELDTKLRVIIGKIFRRLCNFLTKLRIISEFTEIDSESNYRISKKLGLFKDIIFFKFGYFQNEIISYNDIKVFPKIIECPNVDKLFDEIQFGYSELVFVHIRRTDYLSWPSKEYPAILPSIWYLDNMNYLRSKLTRPLFLVCTDDIIYAKNLFLSFKDVFISEFDEKNDFYLMTKCQHGILSASSYAWWAGLLSKRNNPNGIFIAPMYWAGHKQGVWFPPKMISNWIYYVNVF